MKFIIDLAKHLTLAGFFFFLAGCGANSSYNENLAVAAGFKAIAPTKEDQRIILAGLPANKVTQVNYEGKTYYVLPDLENNQAYVGGPKQFQSYQQLRIQKQISDQNMMAARMQRDAAMNFSTWRGWNGIPPYGWY